MTICDAVVPVCASRTRVVTAVMDPETAEYQQSGRFGSVAHGDSRDALDSVLTPGSPGAGGGVGATAGCTAPPSTCCTVRTVVRMSAAERGCSQARNSS